MAGAVIFLEAEFVRTVFEAVVFLLDGPIVALLALAFVPVLMLE